MKNLSEKAILVNLKIRVWSGKKDDQKVASDIEKKHQAVNAGRYKKNLIDAPELREVHNEGAATRNYIREHTLPWGENGARILPATHYMEFLKEFQEHQFKFEDAVKQFLALYPTMVKDASNRLNGLYRQSDYPPPEKMKKKFYMDVTFDPIAELDDFRLQVDEQEVNRLRKEMQDEYDAKISEATRDIWTRIKDTLGHMVDKLSDRKARFHNSLVGNIQELVELLPKLNITGDNDIDKAVASMKSLVVDPDNLRQNGRFRNQKAKEAQAILEKFSSYMG